MFFWFNVFLDYVFLSELPENKCTCVHISKSMQLVDNRRGVCLAERATVLLASLQERRDAEQQSRQL